jgi:hypothetical protein
VVDAEMLDASTESMLLEWLTTPLRAILNVREGHSTQQRKDFLVASNDKDPRLELSFQFEVSEGFGHSQPALPPFLRPDPYKWATAEQFDMLAQIRVIANNLANRGLLAEDKIESLMKEWQDWERHVRSTISAVRCDASTSDLNIPLGWTLSAQNRSLLNCLARRSIQRTGLTVPPSPPPFSRYVAPEIEEMMLLNSKAPAP